MKTELKIKRILNHNHSRQLVKRAKVMVKINPVRHVEEGKRRVRKVRKERQHLKLSNQRSKQIQISEVSSTSQNLIH